MMFSKKLRCGLKELQVTMQYPNVQEYDGDFNRNVQDSEIDNIISYNINDVNSTNQLLLLNQKNIDLRIGIHDEYGINAMSMDGVGIGNEILKTKYLQFHRSDSSGRFEASAIWQVFCPHWTSEYLLNQWD